MAITLGVDIGLFRVMLEDNASPKTVAELATTLKVDASLLGNYSSNSLSSPQVLTRYQRAQ